MDANVFLGGKAWHCARSPRKDDCITEPGAMPARTFREQLDSLATEYWLLQEQNRQLRARLFEDACPTGRQHWGCDVELPVLCHQLIPEALHLTPMNGVTTPDSNPCHLMEASNEDSSVVYPSERIEDKICGLEADMKHLSLKKQAEKVEQLDKDFQLEASISSDFFASPQRLKTMNEDWKRKPIFANADDMKERVRQKLTKQNYNVTDFYKKTGMAQSIARNQVFESITLAVIGLNALWIWIDTDYNTEDNLINAHLVFQVAEHFFCSYFFVEIIIRFLAFNFKRDCLKDGWFVFDFFLVCVMVLETWVMTLFLLVTTSSSKGSSTFGDASILRIFRLLRLLRMGRMARLLRAMPELVILIKGMVAAFRSVFFTLVLLVILLYIFAIACTQLLKETLPGEKFFRKVPQSMHTLWLRAALIDEIVEVMDEVEKVSILCAILLDVFILAAALTVMNMLVGVLCEVVSAVAASEREEIALSFVKSKVEKIFNDLDIDKDGNKRISKEEFVQILDNREAARAIQEVGVDVVALVDFAEVFFSSVEDGEDEEYNKELSFTEFMEAVVALRGSNSATVKDIMDLRKALMQTMSRFEKQVHGMQELLSKPHVRQTSVSSDHTRGSSNGTSDEVMVDHTCSDGWSKRYKRRGGDYDARTKVEGLDEDTQLRLASRSAGAPKAPTYPFHQDAVSPCPLEEQADSTSPRSSSAKEVPDTGHRLVATSVRRGLPMPMVLEDIDAKDVETLPGML